VLSEVDRTCTRAGIVREGRLMAVHQVDAFHRASIRRMEVRFGGDPPLDELDLPGVRVEERDGRQVVLIVTGELDPLLRVLAAHPVQHLVFPEPTLEEAFVRYYRDDGKAAP
jgi:ABC-2 type transport system ATP-binding protein